MKIRLYAAVKRRIKKKGKDLKIRFKNVVRQALTLKINSVYETVRSKAKKVIYYFLYDLMKNDQYHLKV